MQQEIDFSCRQNSPANQAIMESVKPKLNRHCRVLLAALQRGMRISVADGINGIYDPENKETVLIGDVRARVHWLRNNGYDIKHETKPGGYRTFYL